MIDLMTYSVRKHIWLFQDKFKKDTMQMAFFYTLKQELKVLSKNKDSTVLDQLQKVADAQCQRMSNTKAVEILQEAIRFKKKKFEKKVTYLWLCPYIFLGSDYYDPDLCAFFKKYAATMSRCCQNKPSGTLLMNV